MSREIVTPNEARALLAGVGLLARDGVSWDVFDDSNHRPRGANIEVTEPDDGIPHQACVIARDVDPRCAELMAAALRLAWTVIALHENPVATCAECGVRSEFYNGNAHDPSLPVRLLCDRCMSRQEGE